MIEPAAEIDGLATAVINAAVDVHRALGPGLAEVVYERALTIELTERGVPFVSQPEILVRYKGVVVGETRPDLVISRRLIVELKAVDSLAQIHVAQALAYLIAADLSLALLINFNVSNLLQGVRRVVRTREHT